MIRIFQLSPKPILVIVSILSFSLFPYELFAQNHSSSLPIVVFGIPEWRVPEDDKELTTMKIVSNENGQPNSSTGPFNHYDGFVAIELRGSSSRWFDKRGYAIEVRTEDNIDIDFPLLGMPEEEDWVLHGPYSDKSLLRNAFTYNLAQTTSTWAPKSRFCDVFFGDEYEGIFLLVERVKRDKNRLDIKKLTSDDVTGVDLTGGYILKIDKPTSEAGGIEFNFELPLVDADFGYPTTLIYHDPKPEEIVNEQKNYIQDWMRDFEQILASDDFDDETLGYRPLIDIDSWIDFFLINEITRNVDGFRLSTYMHKKRDDQGGKLHMGPIWDFNLGLGNAEYCEGHRTTGWSHEFNDICSHDMFKVPFHYQRLLQDSAYFGTLLATRWADYRANEWSDVNIFGLFDSLSNVLRLPAEANFDRWPVLGEYVWPNEHIESDYEDALSYTRNWLEERIAWLDAEIPKFVPELRKPFFLGPNPSKGTLVLEGYLNVDYPVKLEFFSASGQRIQEIEVLTKGDPIEVNHQGLLFYKLNTAKGDQRRGKLLIY